VTEQEFRLRADQALEELQHELKGGGRDAALEKLRLHLKDVSARRVSAPRA